MHNTSSNVLIHERNLRILLTGTAHVQFRSIISVKKSFVKMTRLTSDYAEDGTLHLLLSLRLQVCWTFQFGVKKSVLNLANLASF